MRSLSRQLLVVGLVTVASSSGSSAQGAPCSLLSAASLTGLLGSGSTSKAGPAGCLWAGGGKKLISAAYKVDGPQAEMMFGHARQASASDKKDVIADEPGIGDKAFSVRSSFGVAIIMLKKGRLLQLQYHTGARGTPADAAALRPVAKQAIAAY